MSNERIKLQGRYYKNIINDMSNFRRFSHPKQGEDKLFTALDQPGWMFFKLIFYFDNPNGLIGISDMYSNEVDYENDGQGSYLNNTAYNFLKRNGMNTRAELLKRFIELLSKINSDSPWYFKSIAGLDSVLERKMFGKDFKIEEESPKITINCIPDAYDNRIAELLDLYRVICYDYKNKREMLPTNLRKFDVDIVIVQTPTQSMHKITSSFGTGKTEITNSKRNTGSGVPDIETNVKYGLPDPESKNFDDFTSSKTIHLKNCEFNVNSSKSGYGELNNETGFQQTFAIEISVDDAYESRYSEVAKIVISDLYSYIVDGTNDKLDAVKSDTHVDVSESSNIFGSSKSKGMVGNIIDANLTNLEQFSATKFVKDTVSGAIGSLKNKTSSFVSSKLLGNIYGLSLNTVSNIISNPSGAVLGKLSNATQNILTNIKRDDPSSSVGKKLPGHPAEEEEKDSLQNKTIPGSLTFDQRKAQLLRKLNTNQNLFNSL